MKTEISKYTISSHFLLGITILILSGCSSAPTKSETSTAPAEQKDRQNESISLPTPTTGSVRSSTSTTLESVLTVEKDKSILFPTPAEDDARRTPAMPGTSTVEQGDQESPQPIEFINITPFTAYTDNWQNAKEDSGQGGIFSGCYTRLLIRSKINADPGNNKNESIDEYPYSPRSWIARALWGKEFSINFSAKVKVNALEETIPLVTIGHDSNSEGEKWSRVLLHTDQAHPLFLVKGNGNGAIPKITVTMHGSQSITSRGAASALGVVYGVANTIAPTASIITKLNSQSSKDRSHALDAAISKLFGMSVIEEHSSSSDLQLWNTDHEKPDGINVALSIPYPGESWGSANSKNTAIKNRREVGTWIITFDFPRPSIFSDWRICNSSNFKIRCAINKQLAQTNVLREVDSGEVLNYELGSSESSLSLRAYLAQQEWFTQWQAQLISAKGSTKGASGKIKFAANQMCRNIHNTITGLDLNGFDADIVTWAMLKGLPMPEGAPTFSEIKQSNAEDCMSAISLIEAAKEK